MADGNSGTTNYLTLNKHQVSAIIRELESGYQDFKSGGLEKRDEANRTNPFVWLGQEYESKKQIRPYLALYFNGARYNLLINFANMDEILSLLTELKKAYEAW